MLLGLKEPLSGLVEAKFRTAKAAQSLIFSHTELAIIHTTTGIPFQLRYCPALSKKPTSGAAAGKTGKKVDPFENPHPDLLIASVPVNNPTHNLVLNKFPVIPEHFILATKAYKPQTHILEQDDLEITYKCLRLWESEEEGRKGKLFAFFNSGEYSGASQPHRHLQFLPVESMKSGGDCSGWDLLFELNSASPPVGYPEGVPFTHFALVLPSEPTAEDLMRTYQFLYNGAKRAVEKHIRTNPASGFKLYGSEDGSVPISYNLAMTTTTMAICPRRSEGYMLRREDGSEIGFVALNGTTLGGTLMVKNEEEWDVLRTQPKKLDTLLQAIGIPKEPVQDGVVPAQI
ncbi:Ap4A phosphorylase-like protein II [Delitschia confertaspora ATCC 74209]|uniref:Ap4A phosphorylase-like protein II n=1 Tax=Delitschia confertaspora ATCC 74209 TaxID=1513339 RepID=A0A9P4JPP0_9PLEO|nr:Ap4A phosphorylase-like protein II [Delitschia confertaspora ATCC 74209]